MKKYSMLKSLLVVTLVGLFLVTMTGKTYAQRGRISLDERVKFMTKELGLTDAQEKDVRKIYEKAEKDRMDAFQTHKDDRAAVREAVGAIMKDADAKVSALLTDEQKTKFEKIQKDRPRMMMGTPLQKKNMPDKGKDRQ